MGQIKAVNPLSGEELKTFETTDIKKISEMTDSIHRAQNEWKLTPVRERVRVIKKLKTLLLEHQENICKTLAEDVGKLEYEALIGEFLISLSITKYYIRRASKLLKPKRIRHRIYKQKKSYLQYDPLGVVAVITPWNYPWLLSFGPIIAALLAGNGVLFKPSEHTLLSGELLHKLFIDAGIPKELFQIVYGKGDVGQAVTEANVQKINFTGSISTGKKIAHIAAEKLIPVGLELGGKDPFLVFDDAPLERAAKSAIWASNFNCGQTCASVERVIVHKSIAETFIALLKKELDALSFEPFREITTLNNEQQFNSVNEQIEDAKKHSKEVYIKELPEHLSGKFNVTPFIVIEPQSTAKIYSEETFGPGFTVEIADSDSEMISLANKLPYGLTASIWTKNTKKARMLSHTIDAGSVYINDHLAPQGMPEVPWGGVKSSGIGKTRAEQGIHEMCHVKHVSYDRFKLPADFYWYPYSGKKENFFKKCVKFMA